MQDRILKYIISFILCSATIQADSFIFPTSRADALGGTALLSEPSPSEQLLTGSPLENSEKLSIDFGYKRQYDLKELDLVYSTLSYKVKNYNLIAGFTQLGDQELYTQKNIRFGFLFTKSIFTIGNFVTGEFHDFNNRYNSVSRFSYGISLQLRHKDFILSSVIDNLNKPSLTENSQKAEPKLTLYGELFGLKKNKTTFMFSTQQGYKNKFGIGESIKISEFSSLMFGFSTAPIELGGGVKLRLKDNSLIYNSSYHPVLGLTHTVSFLFNLLHN